MHYAARRWGYTSVPHANLTGIPMSRQARLGLIVLGGVLAFMLALFVLANKTFLLSGTFQLSAEFRRVGGLTPGAAVQ